MAKTHWHIRREQSFAGQLDIVFKENGEKAFYKYTSIRETVEFELLEATIELDVDIDHTLKITIPTILLEEFFEKAIALGAISPDHQSREFYLEQEKDNAKTDET